MTEYEKTQIKKLRIQNQWKLWCAKGFVLLAGAVGATLIGVFSPSTPGLAAFCLFAAVAYMMFAESK